MDSCMRTDMSTLTENVKILFTPLIVGCLLTALSNVGNDFDMIIDVVNLLTQIDTFNTFMVDSYDNENIRT